MIQLWICTKLIELSVQVERIIGSFYVNLTFSHCGYTEVYVQNTRESHQHEQQQQRQ